METIGRIIDETPYISALQKEFYKVMLERRNGRIVNYTIKILNRRKEKSFWGGIV